MNGRLSDKVGLNEVKMRVTFQVVSVPRSLIVTTFLLASLEAKELLIKVQSVAQNRRIPLSLSGQSLHSMNINSRSRQTKCRTSADAAGRPRASRRQSTSNQPESFRFDPVLRRLHSGQSQRAAVCYIVRFASRYCRSRNGRDALRGRCGDFGPSA